jgi:hypothetical protein
MTLDQAIPTATAACLGLGGLAKTWRHFPDYLIPTLVAVAGAIIVPALAGWSVMHAVAGFIAGLGSTGVNQMGRQFHGRTGNTQIIQK